jgi:hypothetical protein
MITLIRRWLGLDLFISSWSEDRAKYYERVMLEREGLTGFHRPAPRRWPARTLGMGDMTSWRNLTGDGMAFSAEAAARYAVFSRTISAVTDGPQATPPPIAGPVNARVVPTVTLKVVA